MLRLVLDTNISAPAFTGMLSRPPRDTASVALLRAAQMGACVLVVSTELLDEYVEVLQRPAFGLSAMQAGIIRRNLGIRAVTVELGEYKPVLSMDPDDNVVLMTAVMGKADYLVTNNIKHYSELPGRDAAGRIKYRGTVITGVGDCLNMIKDQGRSIRRNR